MRNCNWRATKKISTGVPPLKIESWSFDQAAGRAEVDDFAAKQEASVGNANLGTAFAGIAGMTTAVGDEFGDARRLHGG